LIKKSDDEGDDKPTFYAIPPLSIKNEIKVLSDIENMSFNALKRYQTDYEVYILNSV
jgi:hypothetical protein